MDIQDRVVKTVSSQLGMEESKITVEMKFVDDLGADSLDTVELVMALEDEFDIEIPDETAEKISSVGEAVEHIKIALDNQGDGGSAKS